MIVGAISVLERFFLPLRFSVVISPISALTFFTHCSSFIITITFILFNRLKMAASFLFAADVAVFQTAGQILPPHILKIEF